MQKIAKAYKRQREEERRKEERSAKRAKTEPGSDLSSTRHRFYDAVFSGDYSDEDDVVEELYGHKKQPSERSQAPAERSRQEKKEQQAADDKGAAPKGVVNSKAAKVWKAEERRRIAEQQAARARQIAREKRQRERRAEHVMLSKRTRKGQPVMANVLSHLMKKLAKDQQQHTD